MRARAWRPLTPRAPAPADLPGGEGELEVVCAEGDVTDKWYDLATAVSAANAIFKIVSKPTKVFWTGQKWDEEIAQFNPPIGNIKDYNSSDIVVADG